MSDSLRPVTGITAALIAGIIAVGGFAPFGVAAAPVIALAVALACVERAANRKAVFATGFAFGFGLFIAGVSWVYVSLHDFGGMPAPVAAAVTILFCAYLAFFPAIALLCASFITAPGLRRLAAFPGAWVFAEWVRGWLFSGFPWLALGYSQAPHSPLAGLAPISGVYGVSLLAALSAGLLVHAFSDGLRRLRWRSVAALGALWIAAGALKLISWTTPVGEPVNVSLLQGNVAQGMKWRPELVASTLEHYEHLVRASSGQLIVLPETALPLFLQEVPKEFLQRITEHAKQRNADVLIGVPELDGERRYFNSVVSFGSAPVQAYRKSHLVPFGEFIPLRPVLAPVVRALAIPLTDFARGDIDQRPLNVAGQRIAVNICYEDAFGEEIIRQLPEATMLVNVSNVAWFGDSIAPQQHLQIAQMRTIETGRPMLRATNTGMTAAIDARGELIKVAPTFQSTSVEARVQGYDGATPFVVVGNGVIITLAGLLIVGAFYPRRAST